MKIVNVIKDTNIECAPFNWGMSLFSFGCNLHCKMCEGYNYEKVTDDSNIMGKAIELIDKNLSPLHDCVVFIGGEPTIWKEDLYKALQHCHNKGVKTKIFTNGMLPDVVSYINSNGLCDAWSVDFKAVQDCQNQLGISDTEYMNNLDETIWSIILHNLPLEIRTTFYDGNLKDKDILVEGCTTIINRYKYLQPYAKYIIQNDARKLQKGEQNDG